MIDIEPEVYTKISRALKTEFPKINVSGEYVNAPSRFPYVSIEEYDSFVPPENLDSSDNVRFTSVMYKVEVFSNKTNGKKTECKKISKFIDDLMYRLNFVCTAKTPVPNRDDATIYRIVARYQAKTDGTNIYRR